MAGTPTGGQACWLPIARGLTPHGLRQKVLMDERVGHLDGSVSARYSHVTRAMRERLCQGPTEVWEVSLEQHRALSAGSPVAVLDGLLRAGR